MRFPILLHFVQSLVFSQIANGPFGFPYDVDSAFVPRSDVERLPHVDVIDHPWFRTRMQSALPPESSLTQIRVPREFQVRLFAAEPLMGKSVAMTWDERGRLWLVESEEYPNPPNFPYVGRDRVRILEDTDGDGRADSSIIFADSLFIPTGICLVPGGVVVAAAPYLYFFRDRNGDGRADERQILYTGFTASDTHGGPNHLTYGPDGWLYGVCGSGGTVLGRTIHSGLWRARLDGTEMQFLSYGSANNWGLGFSQEGDLFFGATENRASFLYNGIPGSPTVLAYNFAHKAITSEINQRLMPCNFDATCSNEDAVINGNYWLWTSAGMGQAIYTADQFPESFLHKSLFLCEPTVHAVTTGFFNWAGGQPRILRAAPLFASYDAWTAPIGAEVGPDGAVWVLDWYNYMVNHIAVPPEAPLRDHTRGRVFRILPSGGLRNPAMPSFNAQIPATLAALFSHPNLFWRMNAQRMLLDYGAGAESVLWPLLDGKSVDAYGHSPSIYHAIWTLEILGAWGGADSTRRSLLLNGLRVHPSAAVRRAAVEIITRHPGWPEINFVLPHSLLDPDARIRRTALQAWVGYLAADSAARAGISSVTLATGALSETDFSISMQSLIQLLPSLTVVEAPAWTPDPSSIPRGENARPKQPIQNKKRVRIPKEALLGRFFHKIP